MLLLSDPNPCTDPGTAEPPCCARRGSQQGGALEQGPCAIRNDPHRQNLPWGMHSLLPATPGRYFPVWRLRSPLMPSTPRSEFTTRADLSQSASAAAWALQHLLPRGDPWHRHIPPAQTHPHLLQPWQEPPSPVQSCRTDMRPRQDALRGVRIPALSPEAEITSRKCFCVVSASSLLAPLLLH